MTTRNLGRLAEKINYQFNDIQFLKEALRHSSYVNEQPVPMPDNERFEFLGDAVLSLIIGHLLIQKYPDMSEGDLSLIRSNLVNENQLAEIARSLKLGDYLQLGKGESNTNGREKKSILANAFEALIAAVYLDGGFKAAFQMVEKNFSSIIGSVNPSTAVHYYKTRLQELVQSKRHQDIPHYTIINEIGPDHEKTFIVQLEVGKHVIQGAGKSKKMAEQDAAKKALEIIKKEGF